MCRLITWNGICRFETSKGIMYIDSPQHSREYADFAQHAKKKDVGV